MSKKSANKKLAVILAIGALLLTIGTVFWILKLSASASGPGYNKIEDTQNARVIELTNRVAELYPISPELLQAIIFYESSNQMVRSGPHVGYMQINENIHAERARRLGVSLSDPWGNILTGTDYLWELAEEHEDAALVLMLYNGYSKAQQVYEAGSMSAYADNILTLAEKLERFHGK